MKKIMVLALGIAFALGTVSFSFAQDTTSTTKKTKKKKKGGSTDSSSTTTTK